LIGYLKSAFCVISILFIGFAINQNARCQDSTPDSNALIIRRLMQDIADSISQKIEFEKNTKIVISVEGDTCWHTLIENALIDALKKKGLIPFIHNFLPDSSYNTLNVYVLETKVIYKEVEVRTIQRNLSIAIEARYIISPKGECKLLETLRKEYIDTLKNTDYPLTSKQLLDKRDLLETLISPVIVISGVILIVYLFFTVRS